VNGKTAEPEFSANTTRTSAPGTGELAKNHRDSACHADTSIGESSEGAHRFGRIRHSSVTRTFSATLKLVDAAVGDNGREWAQLAGGPSDGGRDLLESDTFEVEVIMTDGQRHLYRRTDTRRESDGRSLVLFEWVGRQYGLK
jgi:hypothetical protein